MDPIKVIRRSGLLIPRDYKDQFFYKQIKNFLTRKAKKYGTNEIVINKFFLEDNNYLIIPRFFPIKDFVDCEIEDKSHDGEDIDIDHSIELRNNLQQKVINHLSKTPNTTLELEPGIGKTVLTIYDIVEKKKKPLIIVHTTDLTKQWKKEFLEHTNMTEDDILMVSSSNYHKMKDYKIIISTNQTILSLLKRDKRNFLVELNKANIGIFIGDEAHTSIGAASFSECSIHVPAKITRALSATPYRTDRNGDIIEFHMGNIYSDESMEGTMKNVRVTMLLMDFGLAQPKRSKYLYWNGDFQRGRYLTLMNKFNNCPRFHKILDSLIKRLRNNDDRDIIVMFERTKMIDNVFNRIKLEDKGRFYKNNSLNKLNHKLVFATPNKMKEGIDAPWKDCLILTSPIPNIKQMAGRVCRSHDNKEDTIIIDMIDFGCYEIAKTTTNRISYYKNKKWSINYLVVDLDGNIRQSDEEEAFKLISLKRGN